MKRVYLAAIVIGAVVPYLFFIDFIEQEGFGLTGFLEGAFANGAAGGFAADVVIASAVFWHYMFTRRDGPNPWPIIVVNLLIGLSCALPLYLYLAASNEGAAPAGSASRTS